MLSAAQTILVSAPDYRDTNQAVYRYSLNGGQALESFSVPEAGDGPVHDLIVDSAGRIQAFVGTRSPRLVTYDPKTGDTTIHTAAGWASANIVGSGGVVAYGDFVFVSSEGSAAGAVGTGGIIRFDTTNGYASKLFPGSNYRDLAIGLDGNLYALTEPNGNGTAGDVVDVFNPTTMALVRSVPLPYRNDAAVAADAIGNIYICGGPGLYRMDANGNLVKTVTDNGGTDIDLSANGRLLTNYRGQVVVADTSLEPILNFTPTLGDTGESYVAWGEYEGPAVTPPPPATAIISGSVFHDTNASGLHDVSEGVLSGVKIYADLNINGQYDSGEPIVRSDQGGNWSLTNLAAGKTYFVRQVVPSGFRQTTPTTRSYFLYRAVAGKTYADNVFGDVTTQPKPPKPVTGTASGHLFNDADGNRRQGSSEAALSGWYVFLDDNANGKLDKGERFARTDANGDWSLTGLIPGTYEFTVLRPYGWAPTTPVGGKFDLTLAAGVVSPAPSVGERRVK